MFGLSSNHHSSSRRKISLDRRSKRRLVLETLELRQMMDIGGVTAFMSQNYLYIDCTVRDDHVDIRFENGKISIPGVPILNANGQLVSQISRSEAVNGVIAVGREGNDYIAAVEVGAEKALPIAMYGGPGDDTLIGGSSNDSLFGMEGIDTIFGGAGDDRLFASLSGDNADLAQFNTVPERLFGGEGNDSLFGSKGMDWLDGAEGEDKLYGMAGDDRLTGGFGLNTIDGGTGNDILEERDLSNASYTAGRFNVLRALPTGGGESSSTQPIGIERLEMWAATGFDGVTLDFSTFPGDVILHGGDGADILKTGPGNDQIFGGDGDDQISAGDGRNLVDGGANIDSLIESLSASSVILSKNILTNGRGSTRFTEIERSTFIQTPAYLTAIRGKSNPFNIGSPVPYAATSGPTISTKAFKGGVTVKTASGLNATNSSWQAGRLIVATAPTSPADPYSRIKAHIDTARKMGKVFIVSELYVIDGMAIGRLTNGGALYDIPGVTEILYMAKELYAKYQLAGGEKGELGFPNGTISGRVNEKSDYVNAYMGFQKGIIVATGNVTTATLRIISGEVYKHFFSQGGFATFGEPTSDVYDFGRITTAQFVNGQIFINKALGNRASDIRNIEDKGADRIITGVSQPPPPPMVKFYEYYQGVNGFENRFGATLGPAVLFRYGNNKYGYRQDFANGSSLYWKPDDAGQQASGGAFSSVQGVIAKTYDRDHLGVNGKLGLPIGDEKGTGSINNRRYESLFEHGKIVFLESARKFYVDIYKTNGTLDYRLIYDENTFK